MDDEETTPFWDTLFQDDDLEVPSMRSMKRRQQRSMWGQSRRPTFWGLDKEQEHESTFWGMNKRQPKTSFWGLDEEPMTRLFEDDDDTMLYGEDMEMPTTMRSMTRKYRPMKRNLQTRKSNTFWGMEDNEMPIESRENFWGMDTTNEPVWENVNEFETTYGEKKRLVTPVMKNKMMEIENKVCISLERIPECPFDTRPVNKVEKRVVYTCLHRNDPVVNTLENKVRYGESVTPIVERMTPSKTRTEVVPTKCTKMF
jgi:hypothetical protein